MPVLCHGILNSLLIVHIMNVNIFGFAKDMQAYFLLALLLSAQSTRAISLDYPIQNNGYTFISH
jgi:hypothetical protein